MPGPGSDEIRVVVCDDHSLFRRGLIKALDETPDIVVVAEASGGVQVVEMTSSLVPDVVLMDVSMPSVDGIDATRLLVDSLPSIRILMLSVSDSASDLFESIKAGAVGYVLKDQPFAEIVEAVRAVAGGRGFVTSALAGNLIAEYAKLARRSETSPGLRSAPGLSPTELEILGLLAEGATDLDVARRMLLTQDAVKGHVRDILDKLQLHTRAEAVLHAVRERLVDP